MKSMNKYLQQILLLGGVVCAFSCTNSNPEKIVALTNTAKSDPPAHQFPFYKDISIRPGLDFEVVSWGKGKDSVGGYLVLMSDSVKNNFKSVSVERNGVVKDAWNMDLDHDGNPELYVELMTKGNIPDLNVYEFSGGSFQKISFPGLGDKWKKVYSGNDQFQIKNGDLYRSFEIKNSTDSNEKSPAKTLLKYNLSGNTFSSSEVKNP
ncbi:MAG: hypothetical protein EOO88_17510 [Pedobacter sp.]|nr:MAG: hypothetical protein EOO88_17510 [Pedobacter sp.]